MVKRELRRKVERALGRRRARAGEAGRDDDGATRGEPAAETTTTTTTTTATTVAPSHRRKAKRRAKFLESAFEGANRGDRRRRTARAGRLTADARGARSGQRFAWRRRRR